MGRRALTQTVYDSKTGAFLAGLRATGTMRFACGVSGISQPTAYKWRADDPDFAEAWDRAKETGKQRATNEEEMKRIGRPAGCLPDQAHYWRIDEPNGPISGGVCIHCGAKHMFLNWLEADVWNSVNLVPQSAG